MQTISFNLHDKLKLRVKTEKRSYYRVIKRLRVEYGPFTIDDFVIEPDICITIGPINKLPSDYVKLDNKYLIGDNWIYASDSYKVAKWKVCIEGLESDKINVYTEPNFFACDLIPPIIVTPLIAFQLLKKGFSLVHAAGISDGNNATLLTGFGGSGKTLNVLRALGKGLKLLGDDHVILNEGRILSFATAVSLFNYNIPEAPNWITRWRFEMKLKSLLHKLSLGYVYPVTKAPLQEVIPDAVIQSSKLQKVILLEPQFDESYLIEEIDRQELIGSWMLNMLSDSIYLYKYLAAYSYVNPEFYSYFDKVKNILSANLAGCQDFIRITFPQDDKDGLFEAISNLIGCITRFL